MKRGLCVPPAKAPLSLSCRGGCLVTQKSSVSKMMTMTPSQIRVVGLIAAAAVTTRKRAAGREAQVG